jgi:hypothetical protein
MVIMVSVVLNYSFGEHMVFSGSVSGNIVDGFCRMVILGFHVLG